MNNENSKLSVIKLALILFAITFIATLLLTLCNYMTKDKIASLQAQNAEAAKQAVIADAKFNEISIPNDIMSNYLSKCGSLKIFSADKDGEFSGYCFDISPNGYIGPINMIVGINSDMSFAGIKIISMSETPGLGAKTSDKAFYGQFAEGKKGMLNVVKNSKSPSENEINAVSGATISSKAITEGANYALEIAKTLNERGIK